MNLLDNDLPKDPSNWDVWTITLTTVFIFLFPWWGGFYFSCGVQFIGLLIFVIPCLFMLFGYRFVKPKHPTAYKIMIVVGASLNIFLGVMTAGVQC